MLSTVNDASAGADESKEVLRRMRLEAELCASPDMH